MRIKPKIYILVSIFVFLTLSLTIKINAKQIAGIVFEDLNKNLVLDKGEKGIPGVLVSNQRDVVQTDEEGQFKISVDDETIIFLTKPAGYTTPVNENNLPQFYYINQPKGSPDQNFKFKGVAPTGNLPKSLKFPLFKITEQDTFNIIAFADPQPRDHKEIGYIRDDVAAELIGTKAVCGITLGDIAFDDLALYDHYNSVISQIGIPFYNVPGNHDENYDSPDDRLCIGNFQKKFWSELLFV